MLELPVRPQGAELIRTVGLTRHFRLGGFLSRRFLHAVDDIDLSIHEDEIVARGGQRQRIGFAQALACRPELILADEPVSMLDVSVRIGVLNLMASLRRRERISFLYITHDIASARYVADRLVVMYAGQVAESGPVEDVLAHPKHPYTQLLLSAVPDPNAVVSVPSADEVHEPPRVIDPGEGCRFRGRCPYAIDECSRVTPRLRVLRPAHDAACHVATSDLERSNRPGYEKDTRAQI